MGIDKLQRVMQRLRLEWTANSKPSYDVLRRAIIKEIGSSPSTYYQNKDALTRLGWIKTYNQKRFRMTDRDLTEAI